jgi:indole-3-glycerol phosphate synthase
MKGVTTTNTILDKIMAHKVEEISEAKKQVSETELLTQARQLPPPLDMAIALRKKTVALIAECKKASPSKGVFLEDFSAPDIAHEYEQHGASAISVLTDERYFQGHLDYLRAVKDIVNVPVLRKEFVLDTYQVVEAKAAGADAVLLIAACLDDNLLADLHQAANGQGLTALVEVHNEAEMERVLKLNPTLVGINNRNLHDFNVDLNTTVKLAKVCPAGVTLVGESGINTAADVQRMAEAGVHAVLVGESLMLADDRPAKIRELSGVQRT